MTDKQYLNQEWTITDWKDFNDTIDLFKQRVIARHKRSERRRRKKEESIGKDGLPALPREGD